MARLWSTWRRRTAPKACAAAPNNCPGICALAACVMGSHAMVLRVECGAADACRLRALGVYEGARVVLVDGRNGYLLDVRGSRLAVDAATARSIVVQPLAQ